MPIKNVAWLTINFNLPSDHAISNVGNNSRLSRIAAEYIWILFCAKKSFLNVLASKYSADVLCSCWLQALLFSDLVHAYLLILE